MALCAMLWLAIAACSSSSSPDGTAVGTLKATVEGEAFNASLATTAVNTGGVLAIAGSDSRGRQIQVRIIGADKAGTYSLGGLTNMNVATVTLAPEASQTFVTSMIAGTGSVVITEFTSSRVAGTFSFTALNSATVQKKVTDGSFNLNLTK
jgi:hypothetical protein